MRTAENRIRCGGRLAMTTLRGNLHTHTTLSDGKLSPEEVMARYAALGYDFLAFTDHRCFIGPGEERAAEYRDRLPKSTPELLILAGIEEEPDELRGRHLGVIRAGEEELRILNHPSEYKMSVGAVLESAALVGAHAVEITCHGRYLAEYDVPAITLSKVATDDAHYAEEIGVSWILVEAERDPADILRAIKAGRFERVIRGR